MVLKWAGNFLFDWALPFADETKQHYEKLSQEQGLVE